MNRCLNKAKQATSVRLHQHIKKFIDNDVPYGSRFGLAVSGGVDSMALAAIWADMNMDKSRFRAFIVDHQAREGSDVEARKVSDVLEQRGIPATVLKLEWPREGKTPSQLSNFETKARKLRYQALGRACREYGISYLILAHHSDDRAETVLLRLMRGDRSPLLGGMRQSSHIPECEGMYGVSKSGSFQKSSQHHQTVKGGLKIPAVLPGILGGPFDITDPGQRRRSLAAGSKKDRNTETTTTRYLHERIHHILEAAGQGVVSSSIEWSPNISHIDGGVVERTLNVFGLRLSATTNSRVVVPCDGDKSISVKYNKTLVNTIMTNARSHLTKTMGERDETSKGPRTFATSNGKTRAVSKKKFGIKSTAARHECREFESVNAGLRIVRPFLPFSKKELIETCIDKEMRWFEDLTNQDPTLTPRNAIRALITSGRLPEALRKERLLDLCDRMLHHSQTMEQKVQEQILNYQITRWHPQSGLVRVRFYQDNSSHADVPSQRTCYVTMLQALFDAAGYSGTQTAVEAQKIMLPIAGEEEVPGNRQKIFGVSNLMICRVDEPLLSGDESAMPLQGHEWLIYRTKPAPPDLVKKRLVCMPETPKNGPRRNIQRNTSPLEAWQLFDNRFWINISNRSGHVLHVTHITFENFPQIHEVMRQSRQWPAFMDIRKIVAPGNAAWGIPVIMMEDSATGETKPIALPTLGLCLPDLEQSVSWRVKYKMLPAVFCKEDVPLIQIGGSGPHGLLLN